MVIGRTLERVAHVQKQPAVERRIYVECSIASHAGLRSRERHLLNMSAETLLPETRFIAYRFHEDRRWPLRTPNPLS
jgi:hypothetical protein